MSSHPSLKPTLPLDEYTVGWINALSIEAAAAAEMLDEEHEALPHDSNDPTIYTLGRISGHAVVIGCLPAGRMGTTSAAVIATRMTAKFPSIRIGLMVGIGGGNPTMQDVRLGDVVVSQPHGRYGGVVQYDMGKETLEGFKETGHLDAPPNVLLSALAKAQANALRNRSRHLEYLASIEDKLPRFRRSKAGPDILYQAPMDSEGAVIASKPVERQPRDADELVQVHFGTIASDNKVIKNGRVRDELSQRLGGVLCFEMEASGLMNTFPCLVIRGICDYADAHKNDRWQAYAAASSAAYAKELLSVIPVENVNKLSPAKGTFLVPFRRNDLFSGRETLLKTLHRYRHHQQCPYVAVFGLGGCGKTAVAIEFAYQLHAQEPRRSVFWVPAVSQDSFKLAYLEIAQALKLPGAGNPKFDVLPLVKQALGLDEIGPWLMIVDSADDLDVLEVSTGSDEPWSSRLRDCLPNGQRGMVLFTTRTRKAADSLARGHMFPLDQMEPNEARDCLTKLLQHPHLFKDESAIQRLLKDLTYLPLAIVQAATYMVRNNTTVSTYITLYQDNDNGRIQVLSQGFADDRRYKKSSNAVAITWHISFSRIQKEDPLAADCMAFMACIAPEKIPLLHFFPSNASLLDRNTAIGTLNGYHFISKEAESDFYDMHQLVHLAIRNWLEKERKWLAWIDHVVQRLTEKIPYGDIKQREKYILYLPHGLHVVHHPEVRNTIQGIDLLERIGYCQSSLGQYKKAEESQTIVVNYRKQTLGIENEDTLLAMNNLAYAIDHQGNYRKAEEIYEETLKIKKQFLGQEHLSDQTTMNNLAAVLSKQGKYTEAETIHREILLLRETVFSKNLPNTLSTKNNLAEVLRQQGKYTEAETIHRETLLSIEKLLGNDHPDTLNTKNNLGLVLQQQGKYTEAETMHRETLLSTEKVLGKDHPGTLNTKNNLAEVLRQQGKYTEAETMHRETLLSTEKVLGKDHPDTLSTKNNLGLVLEQQGKYIEAETMHRETLLSKETALGKCHPSTLMSMHNLAQTLAGQNKHDETKQLRQETLRLRRLVMGDEHPDTLKSVNDLALVLDNEGKYAEAETMHREALELSLKVLGEQHPETLVSLANLSWNLKYQKRYAEAQEMLASCVELSNIALGPEHSDSQDRKQWLSKWRRFKPLEIPYMPAADVGVESGVNGGQRMPGLLELANIEPLVGDKIISGGPEVGVQTSKVSLDK